MSWSLPEVFPGINNLQRLQTLFLLNFSGQNLSPKLIKQELEKTCLKSSLLCKKYSKNLPIFKARENLNKASEDFALALIPKYYGRKWKSLKHTTGVLDLFLSYLFYFPPPDFSIGKSYKMADLSSSLFEHTPLGLSPCSLSPVLVLGNQILAYTHFNPPPKSKQIKHPHSEWDHITERSRF